MKDNIKFAAAYIHLVETIRIFDGVQTDIAETLLQLANWIKREYNVTDEDIDEIRGIIKDLKNGKAD